MITWGRRTEASQATGGQKLGGCSRAMYRCSPAARGHGRGCSQDEGPLSDWEQPGDAAGLLLSRAGCLNPAGAESSRPVCPRCDVAAACLGRARAVGGADPLPTLPRQQAVPHGHGGATAPSSHVGSPVGPKRWRGPSKNIIDTCLGGRCSGLRCLLHKCCVKHRIGGNVWLGARQDPPGACCTKPPSWPGTAGGWAEGRGCMSPSSPSPPRSDAVPGAAVCASLCVGMRFRFGCFQTIGNSAL